jgi:hypothetical protein
VALDTFIADKQDIHTLTRLPRHEAAHPHPWRGMSSLNRQHYRSIQLHAEVPLDGATTCRWLINCDSTL